MKGIPATKFIEVVCENCGEINHLEYSKDRTRLNQLIDFMVCSFCKKPRVPSLHTEDIKECSLCHVPAKKLGMCAYHYKKQYMEKYEMASSHKARHATITP